MAFIRLLNSKKVITAALWLTAACLLVMPQLRYYALNGYLFDLGVLDGMIANASADPGRMLLGHAHPVGWVYAVVSSFLGDATTSFLLLSQSLLVLACIYLLWRHTHPLVALLFGLHPAIWWLAINGFHFDAASVLCMVLFYLCLERQRFMQAAFFAILAVMAKETFALFTIGAGVCMMWQAYKVQRKESTIWGALAMVFGAAWFLLTTKYLLPAGYLPGLDQYNASAFGWLGGSLQDVIITLVTRPFYVAEMIAGDVLRMVFFGVLLGGFGFMVFARPSYWIPVLPLLLVHALAKNTLYFSYSGHYMAPLVVAGAFTFYHTFQKLPVRLLPVIVCIAGIVHVVFSPSPVSRIFWSERMSVSNYSQYVTTPRDAEIARVLDDNRSLFTGRVVTTQNSLYYHPMRQAQYLLPFPQGVGAAHPFAVLSWKNGLHAEHIQREAEVVVLDLKRPKFMVDRGCVFEFGECRDQEVEVAFDAAVAAARKQYRTLYENDGFMILVKP